MLLQFVYVFLVEIIHKLFVIQRIFYLNDFLRIIVSTTYTKAEELFELPAEIRLTWLQIYIFFIQ